MSRYVLLIKKPLFLELLPENGILQKGGKLPVGSIRTWGGKEYVKVAPGKWEERRVQGKEPWDSSSEKAKDLKISDFGTLEEVREMANMPLIANSFLEARNILENLVDKPLANKHGLSATISMKSVDEILSGEAIGKSSELKAHLKAAANIETLFSNAIVKWEFGLDPNKNNDSLKDRKYLYSPMEYKGRIIPVKLTVKEFKDKYTSKRLYSIEAIDVGLS